MNNQKKNSAKGLFKLNAIMLCSGLAVMLPNAPLHAAEENAVEKSAVKAKRLKTIDDVEVITVTGIQGSLRKALNDKRFSDQIKDSINAEDIGQLPDDSIAEAMQRITGVLLERDFGEGIAVSIRGVTQNRVEMDGRTLPGVGLGSTADIGSLSPDLLKSVEVIKSPTADMTEGSMGGSIKLSTRRALDINKAVVNIRAGYNHNDVSEKSTPNVSLYAADKWQSKFGDIGLTFGLTYAEKVKAKQTQSNTWKTQKFNKKIFLVGSDIELPLEDNALITAPNRVKSEIYNREEEKIATNLSLHWRPQENFNVYLDGAYSQNDGKTTSTRFQVANLQNLSATDVVLSDLNTITQATYQYNANKGAIANWSDIRRSDASSFSLAMDYETDYWFAKFMVASSSVDNGEQNVTANTNIAPATTLTFINSAPGSNALATLELIKQSDGELVDLTDPSIHNHRQLGYYTKANTSDIVETKLDLEYQVDYKDFTSVEFGFRNEISDSTYNKIRGASSRTHIGYQPFPVAEGDSGYGILAPHTITMSDYGFSGGIREWATIDLRDYWGTAKQDAYEEYFDWSLDKAANNGDDPSESTDKADITETSNALYVKANFSGEFYRFPYSANLGLRYVDYNIEARGVIDKNWYDTNDVLQSRYEDISVDHGYDDLLKSANIQFGLRDDTILRFAYGDVVARKGRTHLSSRVALYNSSLTGTRGDPTLDPYRAAQYDMSLEWYGEGIKYASLGLFYKDVKSDVLSIVQDEDHINTDTGEIETYAINASRNVDGSRIRGVEVGVGSDFGMIHESLTNFGINANYTYIDSVSKTIDEVTGERLPVPGLSKNSGNIILFYDDGEFNTRIAYNFRSDYNRGYNSGFPIFGVGNGQIDISTGYKINKTYKVDFGIKNLTKEIDDRYLQYPERVFLKSATGRTYRLNFSARF